MRWFLLIVGALLAPISATALPSAQITVDRAGRGDFRTIGEAIDSLTKMERGEELVTLFIYDGFYKEKLDLPPSVTNVRFVGQSAQHTIINYDDHANIDSMGTFRTYTFRIGGSDLLFENITFENSAQMLGQAVATHITGDRIIFRNCRFLGNQDTIYVGEEGCRHYFEQCYIEGTTDFLFGPATAYFQECQIVCKKKSYITAPNTPRGQQYGIILNSCKVTVAEGVSRVYLGRPWRPYGMSLFMNCHLGKGIAAEGWDNWRDVENEKTARFSEYNNCGEGTNSSERVKWSRELTPQEAKEYSVENVLRGSDGWNPLIKIEEQK